jgi:hypothetical protein
MPDELRAAIAANAAKTASSTIPANPATSEELTTAKYNALNDYTDNYVDPYAALSLPKSTSSNAPYSINDFGVNYNEPNTEYAIDRAMSSYIDPQDALGEYIDPALKKKSTTNLVASGLPVKTSFAGGGSTTPADSPPNNTDFIDSLTEDVFKYIRPGVTRGNANYSLPPGYPYGQQWRIGMAEGGEVGGHNPQFFSEGGLNSLGNTYVTGDGDGTSDSIPAMLANGEFVIPADIVSGLGNGSNDSGAKVLDEFLKTIRAHKQKTGADKLPPDSKGPLGYLLEAKRKMKA